ncbi:MAG: HAD-IA family hydrolase [bacterium]
MQKLKALFFDIDDTLYSTSEFANTARLNSVQAMINAGLKVELTECFREMTEVIKEFGSNFGFHYDKLLLRLPKETYTGVNPAVIIAAGMVAYHETKFKSLKPYEDVIEIFQLLSKTKLVIGIITAGLQIKQAEKLVRLNLLKYINPQAIFITDQIGIGKSNEKLYRTACELIGILPHNCMYVGDNPFCDVDPVKRIGMISVLNRRSGKYMEVKGQEAPDYIIHNMWELVEILRNRYNVKV